VSSIKSGSRTVSTMFWLLPPSLLAFGRLSRMVLGTAQEAIKCLRKRKIDLLFLDLQIAKAMRSQHHRRSPRRSICHQKISQLGSRSVRSPFLNSIHFLILHSSCMRRRPCLFGRLDEPPASPELALLFTSKYSSVDAADDPTPSLRETNCL
jgi:hypothetical protein